MLPMRSTLTSSVQLGSLRSVLVCSALVLLLVAVTMTVLFSVMMVVAVPLLILIPEAVVVIQQVFRFCSSSCLCYLLSCLAGAA